ncbi:RES domain-containing protein [Oleomonas cavernae]|uniref:RES domain-containing protein n=1 Tax=Oleomonas cavernae TaxID=2320859 RepID=A0A418WGQ9_9PROT|nr:RES family NAD+ phosphorylase [Oleomonas cavernae]RJF89224.1 RES domain-containing protein [Oleomonas cavernae]
MVKVLPPKDFASASLRLHTVPAGHQFGRIYLGLYPDPLGFGKTPSRFSDPRRRIAANRFGVLYLGETLKVCFLEALLRDQRDGMIGDLPIAEAEFHAREYAEIEVVTPLKTVDLRADGAIVMGVPSDVAKATDQRLARAWSVAFHDHPEKVDGIIFPSRLNGRTNLAVFDHSIVKLHVARKMKLIEAPGLAAVLNELHVGIVESDS